MTKNQIEYNKLLETGRANRAQEALTHARDEAARQAKVIELGETSRHNQALEGIQLQTLGETRRHNQAQESIGFGQLSETRRHNTAQERESQRHNLQTESATIIDLTEKSRHNLATEQAELTKQQETARHNKAVEGETMRHNIVGEGVDAGRLALDTVTREQQIAETKRHNIAMELKDYSTKVNLNPTTTITGMGNAGGTSSSPVTPKKPSGGGGKSSEDAQSVMGGSYYNQGNAKTHTKQSSTSYSSSTQIGPYSKDTTITEKNGVKKRSSTVELWPIYSHTTSGSIK